MRKLLLVVGLLVGCATVRTYNADGSPRPLPSEMYEGQVKCELDCAELHRKFLEYRTDGRCVCGPDPRLLPYTGNQS